MRWRKSKQVDKRFAENRQGRSNANQPQQQQPRRQRGRPRKRAKIDEQQSSATIRQPSPPPQFPDLSSNEIPTMSLNEMCRICLRSNECERLCTLHDSIVPKIDSPPTAVIELWKIFNELLVSQDDDLPTKICFDCLEEIQRIYLFMLKCEKADAFLKELKSIQQNVSNSAPSRPAAANILEGTPEKNHVVSVVEIESSESLNEEQEEEEEEHTLIQVSIKDEEESQDIEMKDIDDSDGEDGAGTQKEEEGDDEVLYIGEEMLEDDDEHQLHLEDQDGNDELAAELQKIIMGTNSKNKIDRRTKAGNAKTNVVPGIYECRDCWYRCKDRDEMHGHILRKHLNHHSSKIRRKPSSMCTDCIKLAQEVASDDSDEPEKCKRCKKEETEQSDIVLTPFKTAESSTANDESQKKVSSIGDLSEDVGKSTTPHFVKYINRDGKVIKVFECGICSRNFQHQYTLMRHLPTHTNVRNFICNECGKAFRQLSTLSQHRAIHSVDRPYACETCNKSFNRISTLISHRKTHSDVKPFRCHMCHKGFHQKGNLRNHIYIHTNERPYRCSFCNKGFNQMSNLVCHTQKSHSAEFGSIWTCHRCNMSFSKRTLLRAHELETHHIQGTNTRSNRSKLANPRKSSSISTDDAQQQQQLLSNPTSDDDEPPHCKSEISENGIIIPAIETDAMKTAKANNEMPFAVLHFFEGLPLLVRIIDYGNQSLLRPANSEDFASLKYQQRETTEKVSVPIVAAVYQTLNVAGRPEFKVMPPKNIYKFINQIAMGKGSGVATGGSGDDNNDGDDEKTKKFNKSRRINRIRQDDEDDDDLISLTPPQIPSDLRDVTGNLETPLFETLNSVKDESSPMDDNMSGCSNEPTTTEERPRAIAIVEESNWWKKQNKIDSSDEPEGFSETFQNIATGNLLTPKKITETDDILPDQNASILDISTSINPQLNQNFTNNFGLNNCIGGIGGGGNGCDNTFTSYDFNGDDFGNGVSNFLDAFRGEGVDVNIIRSLFSENRTLLNDFNECLSEILQ